MTWETKFYISINLWKATGINDCGYFRINK